jgi:hypothetical protein
LEYKRDVSILMDIEEKIYKLGMDVLNELLLHRNISKVITISIEDSKALSDMIVYIVPHTIFTFDETEIADFYRVWAKRRENGNFKI